MGYAGGWIDRKDGKYKAHWNIKGIWISARPKFLLYKLMMLLNKR